jgi:uncharacterized protein with von Willebrand factor type A (vWA) domain
MAAKYKKYFDQMFEQNRDEFMQFMILNDQYSQDKRLMKGEFDEKGANIVKIVKEWEDKLCKTMEKGENGAYSAKLGEKFQSEVGKYFPYFHEVGVKISFTT